MANLEQIRRRYYLQGLVKDGQQLEIFWDNPGKTLVCPACSASAPYHPGAMEALCDKCGLRMPLKNLEIPVELKSSMIEQSIDTEPPEGNASDGVFDKGLASPGHFSCLSVEARTIDNGLQLEMALPEMDANLLIATEIETKLKQQVIEEIQSKTGMTARQVLEGDIRLNRAHNQVVDGSVVFDVVFKHPDIDLRARINSTSLGERLASKKKKDKSHYGSQRGHTDVVFSPQEIRDMTDDKQYPRRDMSIEGYSVANCRYEMINNAKDAELQFGRYKGKKISDLVRDVDGISYLNWMLKQRFTHELKIAITMQLEKNRMK